MVKIKICTLLLALFLVAISLNGQCNIENLSVNATSCNNGEFAVTIDFEAENTGNSGFTVLGNGVNYGDFEYNQLPITLDDLDGDCTTEYEFLVRDNANPSCTAVNELGIICCGSDCKMTVFEIETNDCEGSNLFDITINLETEGETGDSVTILVNTGFLLTAAYDEFPLSLNNFEGSGFAQDVFTICDDQFSSCCAQTVVNSPCVCQINDIEAFVVECSDADDNFYLRLDADYSVGMDSFQLFLNNNSFGTFHYDSLPVNVGPFDMGQTTLLDMIDWADPSCTNSIELDALTECPDCSIENLEIEASSCNASGNIDINFSFDAINPTSEEFRLFVNGSFIDFYSYHEEQYLIQDLPGICDVAYAIRIEDASMQSCDLNYFFDEPFCCDIFQCRINNVFALTQNCSNNKFDARISFQVQNPGTEGFEIRGNGQSYGFFEYGESFYTIEGLEADCEFIHEFVIIDVADPNCRNWFEFNEAVCCMAECAVRDIESFDIECTSENTFNVSFNLVHENTSGSFEIKIDGVSAGIYAYAELPIRIRDFPTNGDDAFGVFICDNEFDDCCEDYLLEIPNCASAFDCNIENVFAEAGECNNDDRFFTDIEFDVTNPGSSGFVIQGNGNFYGEFEYGEPFYTVGPLLGDCETKYEFVIIDKDDNDCRGSYVFQDSICCVQTPCNLFDVEIEPIECVGNGFYDLILDFEFEGNTNNFFDVSSQGQFLGSFQFSSLPVTIKDFPERMVAFDIITICENDNTDCCVEHEFMGLDCIQECSITNVFAEAHQCNALGTFMVDIAFDVTAPTSNGFMVVGNGNNYGSFEYGEDFYTVGPLEGDCETIYEFIIIDLENDDCQGEFVFDEPICCDPDECIIYDIEIEPVECDGNGTYTLVLDFEFQGNTNEFFDVTSQGQNLGSFKYEDLPITIENFPERMVNFDIITICDNDNPACCLTHEFVGLDCINNGECTIENVSAVPLSCNDDDEFLVNIFFDESNVGNNGFRIRGNGVVYGNFDYGQPFYTIGPIAGDCETIYDFRVIDLENTDCRGETSFEEPVCCDQNNCMIFDIMIDPIECTGNGTYDLALNFSFSGVSNPFFDVFGPGDEFLGFYNFNDLPITLEDFPERMVDFDYIKICENDNPDCCTEFEFMGLDCFDDLECLITEVFAEAGECDQEGQFFVDVEFDVDNPSDEGFEIRGNGMSYGIFDYGETFYRIGPLDGDCETIYEFIVIDQANNDCSDFFGFDEPICCGDCEIDDLMLGTTVFVDMDGVLFLDLDFNHSNTGNLGFDVFVNDQQIGFFGYDELPVTLEIPLVAFGTSFELKVCDNDSDCCQTFSLELDDVVLCEMDDIIVERSECDGEFFDVTLDFESMVVASDSFLVFGNSTNYGTFGYNELPITLGPLEGDGIIDYSFSISDQLFIDCGILGELGVVKCDPESVLDELWKDITIAVSGQNLIINSNGQLSFDAVMIYDLNGKRLYQNNNSSESISVDIATIDNGMYVLNIKIEDHFITRMIPLID